MTPTRPWYQRLRAFPYPPRAAMLEAEQTQRLNELAARHASEDAAGTLTGSRWEQKRKRMREAQTAMSRELSQMSFWPMIWTVCLILPFVHGVGFFVFMIGGMLLLPVLDPLWVWIGSSFVPHGGFKRWQSAFVFVLSFVVGFCIQVAIRRTIAGN